MAFMSSPPSSERGALLLNVKQELQRSLEVLLTPSSDSYSSLASRLVAGIRKYTDIINDICRISSAGGGRWCSEGTSLPEKLCTESERKGDNCTGYLLPVVDDGLIHRGPKASLMPENVCKDRNREGLLQQSMEVV
ncbi:hypothetical protein Nepgr_013684 [Nepenthes gracilis]|uniref:Uncharacterized protein n=1 Tax=Nepenthes gracilis TaxID=150966 RepID=A0AAD3SIE8_NEPGR|nr:hypothetical protein Nepgr_013684 [Nepenthes gracilis]